MEKKVNEGNARGGRVRRKERREGKKGEGKTDKPKIKRSSKTKPTNREYQADLTPLTTTDININIKEKQFEFLLFFHE